MRIVTVVQGLQAGPTEETAKAMLVRDHLPTLLEMWATEYGTLIAGITFYGLVFPKGHYAAISNGPVKDMTVFQTAPVPCAFALTDDKDAAAESGACLLTFNPESGFIPDAI